MSCSEYEEEDDNCGASPDPNPIKIEAVYDDGSVEIEVGPRACLCELAGGEEWNEYILLSTLPAIQTSNLSWPPSWSGFAQKRYAVIIWDAPAVGPDANTNLHVMWAAFNWDGNHDPREYPETATRSWSTAPFAIPFEPATPAGEYHRSYMVQIFAQRGPISPNMREVSSRQWIDAWTLAEAFELRLVSQLGRSYVDWSPEPGQARPRSPSPRVVSPAARQISPQAESETSIDDYCNCLLFSAQDALDRMLHGEDALQYAQGQENMLYVPPDSVIQRYRDRCGEAGIDRSGGCPPMSAAQLRELPDFRLLGLAYVRGLVRTSYWIQVRDWYSQSSANKRSYTEGEFLDPTTRANIINRIQQAT